MDNGSKQAIRKFYLQLRNRDTLLFNTETCYMVYLLQLKIALSYFFSFIKAVTINYDSEIFI